MRLGLILNIVLLFLLLFSSEVSAVTSFSLYINSAEGGEVSNRRTEKLKQYFNQNGCHIKNIEVGTKVASQINSDFIFMPLEQENLDSYTKLVAIKMINSEPLSSSILVRGSTGITDLKDLEDVRIAYMSVESKTGFALPQAMFKSIGINHANDRITYTQTNIGAMSLLLHKDVFAAAVASPLAEKWARANDLNIVSVSEIVEVGGVFVKQSLSKAETEKCQNSLVSLSEKTRENKKLLRSFPAWVSGFIRTRL